LWSEVRHLAARCARELSDANIIVQNSPTILYRLRGEPSFPLIYISHNRPEMHEMNATVDVPLNAVPYEKLQPGAAGLAKILKRYA